MFNIPLGLASTTFPAEIRNYQKSPWIRNSVSFSTTQRVGNT